MQVNGSYGRMSDLTEALIGMSGATGLAIVSDMVKSWAAASGESGESGEERAWKLWQSCGVKLEQFMPPGSSESDVHKHLKDQVGTQTTNVSECSRVRHFLVGRCWIVQPDDVVLRALCRNCSSWILSANVVSICGMDIEATIRETARDLPISPAPRTKPMPTGVKVL